MTVVLAVGSAPGLRRDDPFAPLSSTTYDLFGIVQEAVQQLSWAEAVAMVLEDLREIEAKRAALAVREALLDSMEFWDEGWRP